MKRKNKQAQLLLEYAVLIALVAAALIAMQVYFRRSVQEKYRQSADVFGQGEQYAKGATGVTDDGGAVEPPILPPNNDGTGDTFPPELSDTCSSVLSQAATLEQTINSFNAQVSSLEESVGEAEAQIPPLEAEIPSLRQQAQALRQEAELKKAGVERLTDQVANLRYQASVKQEQINEIKQGESAECFAPSFHYSAECGSSGWWPGKSPCCEIVDKVKRLEKEKDELQEQATAAEKEATQLDNEAADLNNQANSLEDSAMEKEAQVQSLQAQVEALTKQAADLRAQVESIQAQLDQFKAGYPECF